MNETNKVHAWVYTITKNTITDFYRTQRHNSIIPCLSKEFSSEEQEEAILNYEISQCLKPMIQCLPEKYKQALILTEFQNLTQKELANSLGLSVSGAKSRVQRARALLKEMILDCCNLELDYRGNIIDYKRKSKNCKNLDCKNF